MTRVKIYSSPELDRMTDQARNSYLIISQSSRKVHKI